MTSLPAPDPLAALWQTAAGPDTHDLLQAVRRQRRLHQRLNRSVWAIMCGIALLVFFEEATAGIATHGILSIIWVIGITAAAVWQRRARHTRSDALNLDTVNCLESVIGRARADLFVARCLYAGVPGGAVVGYVVVGLADKGVSPHVADPELHLVQLGAGIVALLIMMAAGFLLARSRRLQVEELSGKLRSLQAEL